MINPCKCCKYIIWQYLEFVKQYKCTFRLTEIAVYNEKMRLYKSSSSIEAVKTLTADFVDV